MKVKDSEELEIMMERELGKKKAREAEVKSGYSLILNTGRTNINAVRPKVNVVSSNVNTVRSRQPVPHKTSNNLSNKDQLEDFEEFNKGSVTFGGSKGYISGFAEIVDFLRGFQPQGNALTSNPPINDPFQTVIWQRKWAQPPNTIADGTLEIHATIDTIGYTITEASIRDTLKFQLADSTGINNVPNDEII
ncbi:hypothetical protein Tco_1516347 [Tanacetum coccineum]